MKTLFLYFLLFFSFLAHGQSQKQWLKHADKSFSEKDYYGASIYYRKAMLVDSSNLFVVNRYAESLRLYNEYKLAEKYYKYVYTKDKARAYQESLFWMAMMQKYNGKYIDARKGFILFVNSYKPKDSYYYKKATQEIKSCEYAIDQVKNPKLVRVYNLGDSLNSPDAEFGALLVSDSILYFSSQRADTLNKGKSKQDILFFTKIYSAKKTDTIWKKKTGARYNFQPT
jgi:OOP family OmpA-OmpF porin